MKQSSMSSPARILYVEDEIIVALDVSDGLRDVLGFEVSMAHNLASAQALAEKQEFDLALLDINLGHGERSVALGRALAERGVHVVFASGYNRSEMSEIQGFPLIEKPFQIEDVEVAFRDVAPAASQQRRSAAE